MKGRLPSANCQQVPPRPESFVFISNMSLAATGRTSSYCLSVTATTKRGESGGGGGPGHTAQISDKF